MKALVFAESKDGKLRKIAYENVSLAKKLGLDFECAVIGNDLNTEDLGKYGAGKIVHYKSDKLGNYTPDGYAKILAEAMDSQGTDVLLLGATAM